MVMGHRADPEEGDPPETDLVDERIQLVEAPAIKRGDPERLGRYVAERLEAQAGHFWVHFDVDVFDQAEMPAVTYPLPDGLGWEHAEALLRPLVRSRRLVGLSVADFVPDKDAGREGTRAAWSISSPAYSRHGRQRSERVGPFSQPLLTPFRSAEVPKKRQSSAG